jgi:glycosyltransferase involved in cell wall biosynthesis
LGLPGRYGIGILGRIRPQKGTGDFVEAMIRVLPLRPDWSAVIVGQTTAEFYLFEQRMHKRISEAGLMDRVHFTGFLEDASALPDWYRALSVVVCASRNEGFGLSCLEAMASGCAVIATRTGAWPELITEGSDGFLVPCGDAASLTEALLRMTRDPLAAHRMGQAARDKALSRYRIQNEAEGIYTIYRRLLTEKGVRV